MNTNNVPYVETHTKYNLRLTREEIGLVPEFLSLSEFDIENLSDFIYHISITLYNAATNEQA